MPAQQAASEVDDKDKIATERISDTLELIDKVSKSFLTVFLVLQSLGLFDDRLKSITAEQILPYVVVIFVGLPLLGGLARQAYPQFESQASIWRRLMAKLYRRPWLRQVLFWVSLIAFVYLCVNVVYRDFINQPPEIVDVLLTKPQIGMSEKVELQVLLTDPNGPTDIAKITWTIPGKQGSIEQNADRPDIAEFRAPPNPGDYNVQVNVTDKSGRTASETRTIYVGQSP